MKIEMKIQISGDRDGKPWPAPGDVFDVSDVEAEHLIAQGYAEKPGAKKKK